MYEIPAVLFPRGRWGRCRVFRCQVSGAGYHEDWCQEEGPRRERAIAVRREEHRKLASGASRQQGRYLPADKRVVVGSSNRGQRQRSQDPEVDLKNGAEGYLGPALAGRPELPLADGVHGLFIQS